MPRLTAVAISSERFLATAETSELALTDQWKRTQAYGVDTLTAVSPDAISGQRIGAHRECAWILPPHSPAAALLTMLSELTMFATFDYSQLLDCAHGRLFGNSNARLPAPGMLMVDRIVRIDDDGGTYGKGQIHAELDIRPDLWFFDVHFEDDPVMPGCLGLDAMWQLVGFFLAWQGLPGRGRALGAGAIKFFGQVLPSAKVVSYYIDIKRVVRQRLNLAIGDARMLVDGREIYQASDLRVGLFTSTASL